MVNYDVGMIERYMMVHKLSKDSFCDRCQISRETLDRIYEKDGSVDVTSLLKIILLLNVRMDDFLDM